MYHLACDDILKIIIQYTLYSKEALNKEYFALFGVWDSTYVMYKHQHVLNWRNLNIYSRDIHTDIFNLDDEPVAGLHPNYIYTQLW